MVTQFNKPVVCTVLIDRANDLATLHALIDQAKSGRGQVALLRLSLSQRKNRSHQEGSPLELRQRLATSPGIHAGVHQVLHFGYPCIHAWGGKMAARRQQKP